MTFTNLLIESLYNSNEISHISSKIEQQIDDFKESGSLKRVKDITEFFNIERSHIQSIRIELIKSGITFADINISKGKKIITIRIGITNKENYTSSIRHEIIHAFDFIKSNGKITKYGYKNSKEYYSHEFEFNEKINHITQKLGKIKYTTKKNLLDRIYDITTPDFYGVLATDDKLYQRLLHRLVREHIIET